MPDRAMFKAIVCFYPFLWCDTLYVYCPLLPRSVCDQFETIEELARSASCGLEGLKSYAETGLTDFQARLLALEGLRDQVHTLGCLRDHLGSDLEALRVEVEGQRTMTSADDPIAAAAVQAGEHATASIAAVQSEVSQLAGMSKGTLTLLIAMEHMVLIACSREGK